MKLYHIDRLGTINEKQTLNLHKNIYFENELRDKCLSMIMPYYNEGLSQHGIRYLLNNELLNNNVMPLSNVMEIVFEYERMLNYKDKISRYQAFFAFDNNGVKKFIKQKNLSTSYYKIYEVESDYFEAHNMNLIRGSKHYDTAAMAKIYWENGDDPYGRDVLNEYLLKYPVRIIKEVKLEEID